MSTKRFVKLTEKESIVYVNLDKVAYFMDCGGFSTIVLEDGKELTILEVGSELDSILHQNTSMN